jgi:hypothetical protein
VTRANLQVIGTFNTIEACSHDVAARSDSHDADGATSNETVVQEDGMAARCRYFD